MIIFRQKILFFLFFVFLDQLTKFFVLKNNFSHLCNPYISWGIPLTGFWFWFVLILAFLFLFYLAKQEHFSYPVLLLGAGALGNLIDRWHFHCVIDFISFSAIPYLNKLNFLTSFPTFNLADLLITVGVLFLLFSKRN